MRRLDKLRLAWLLTRGRAALKAGRVRRAEEIQEWIEEIAPAAPAAQEFGKAVQTAALARAKREVEEDPAQAAPRADYARALLRDGRVDEAAAQANEGLKRVKGEKDGGPLRIEMCLVAGETAFEQGKFKRALDLFAEAEEPGFGMAAVHYYRGLCLIALGDKAAGLADLTKLVRMAHWAVPMRHRELIEEKKRAASQPKTA